MKRLIKEIIQFRDERDWKQFHTPKNLALAISIEAAELNELFLWKSDNESTHVDSNKISDELADVLIYSILMAESMDFDLDEIILSKLKKNGIKYPIEKYKGSSKKYTDL